MLAHKPWEVNKTSHVWENRNLKDYKILQGYSLVLQKVKKNVGEEALSIWAVRTESPASRAACKLCRVLSSDLMLGWALLYCSCFVF